MLKTLVFYIQYIMVCIIQCVDLLDWTKVHESAKGQVVMQ